MIRSTTLSLLIILIGLQASFAQSPRTLHAIIESIEFKEDTVKSVFDWVTENIRYDTKAITKPKSFAKKRAKDIKDRINKVLITKKGVCQHYSELTDTLLKTLGFNSYVVTGYVRSPTTGKLSNMGHAWNAVEVDEKWILLDSTWGAGVVSDNKRFRKKYNPYYYNPSPSKMIKSHMPYDPIWQLLEKPIDYRTFDKNKVQTQKLSEGKDFSSIQDYLNKNKIDQLKDASTRSTQLGTSNKLVKNHFHIGEVNRSSYQVKDVNKLYDKVVGEYNTYVKAKNNNAAQSYTKNHIEKWLEEVDQVIEGYGNINTAESKHKNILKGNLQNAKSFKAQLEKVLATY